MRFAWNVSGRPQKSRWTPSRQSQRELIASVGRELGNAFDEILLVRLAEREAVEQSLLAQLSEAKNVS